MTAYTWLLGEGLDLGTTTFVGDGTDGGLALGVLDAARAGGLPLAWGTVSAESF